MRHPTSSGCSRIRQCPPHYDPGTFPLFPRKKPPTHVVQDTMANDNDYTELGQACGEVCEALYERLKGRRSDELNRPVLGAIGILTV